MNLSFLYRGKARWVVSGLLLIALGGWWTAGALTGDAGSWVSVERDELRISVEVSGNLKAVQTELMGPPQIPDTWQFKIAHMAPEGETAKQGTPVLIFDASELQQRLQRELAERDTAAKRIDKAEQQLQLREREAELALAEAEARLRKAELKVDVPEQLSQAQALMEARLDAELAGKEVVYLESKLETTRQSARATLASLRAQLAQAEVQVERTQASIAQMTLLAPQDGTVIYVSNWRGEKKKPGDSCWRGEDVIELPDLSAMKAMGQVHEADAGRVEVGQQVRLRLDAHADIEIPGHVASIWRTVQRESWSSPLRVVRLEIELDETDTERMRPGMRYRGDVDTELIEQTLLVPLEAVFLDNDEPIVFRRSWIGHDVVRVELGRRSGGRVEVLSGLAEGDRVSSVDPRRGRRS